MYYINPWVFYIASLIANIQIACIFVAGSCAVIWWIGLLVGPAITFWKWMKRLLLIVFICTGIAVVTPNEETMYKMLIASKISADDVDHVVERLDDVVDSIIASKEQADDTNS